ncbi:monocarboxylate transporter 12-like [Copidosoma floridanum]|uniref:monocarboxylate transporter 12-like n=1 Tax=Copidosoma floridanum TaxID=29053 RepID=UPI0006C9DDD6|nr:monocarboxylate transporter 12-like [Copidosoma floridanum]
MKTTTTAMQQQQPIMRQVPPDGGWGWLVLCAAVTINVLVSGTVKSFGVLFLEFLRVYHTTPTEASWVTALCYFLYYFLGPLSSYLSIKYSYRTVTMIGGFFASSGLMLSFFANSVTYLYFSYGIMMGIGAGLCYPVTIYIVSEYFERRRGLATGLCISGSTIGTVVLSPLLQFLITKLGHRYTVLILGGLVATTMICALFYHPVERHMKLVPANDPENQQQRQQQQQQQQQQPQSPSKTASEKDTDGLSSRRSSVISNVESITADPRHDLRVSLMRKKLFKKQISQISSVSDEVGADGGGESPGEPPIFQWSILRNPLYLIILVSNSASVISNTNFMILLPAYGVSEGFSGDRSALLLSVVSLFDLIGRIGGASLSDLNLVPKHYYFVSGLGLSGIALALVAGSVGDYYKLAGLCGLFGLASGLYIGTTAVVLADMLGPENLTSSYGITLCVGGALQLVGPPVCTLAYERIGSFRPIFLALGLLLVLGAAFWTLLPLVRRNNAAGASKKSPVATA